MINDDEKRRLWNEMDVYIIIGTDPHIPFI
jgi:hypothetical protein